MNHFVYRHIRLDKNIPFYVGIGTKPSTYRNYEREYKRAFTSTSGRSKHWLSVVSKTSIEVEIIFESNDINEVKRKEIEFIDLYKRRCDGGTLVNLSTGGEASSGVVISSSRKAYLSSINKGKKLSQDHKNKIGLSNRKPKNISEPSRLAMSIKQQKVFGEKHPSAKMNKMDAISIIERFKAGEKVSKIWKGDYSCFTKQAIYSIVNGKNWKCLDYLR